VDINRIDSTLTCLFLGNQSSIERTCSVEYSICGQEEDFTAKGNSTLESPYMVILQLDLPGGSECYTFTVRATDGASTVAIMGKVDSRTGKCSHKNTMSCTKFGQPFI
jgi:hypothetical protein